MRIARISTLLFLLVSALSLLSCSRKGEPNERCLTVSNPAMAYFVSRLAPADVRVNVMIPQGADHDSYTPKPSQMAALANSMAYIAFGPLDFELTWKERMLSAAPNMTWCEMSQDIDLIASAHSHHHHSETSESEVAEESEDHTHASESYDPHYWLSPRQAAILSRNVANTLKQLIPESASRIDSASASLFADISAADSALTQVAASHKGETFVIYHPALAYVARDYGFNQLCIGNDGVAPKPRRFAMLADSARRAGARIFFLQEGFAPDRVESSAEEMNTRIVRFQPESADWVQTMATITSALANE